MRSETKKNYKVKDFYIDVVVLDFNMVSFTIWGWREKLNNKITIFFYFGHLKKVI